MKRDCTGFDLKDIFLLISLRERTGELVLESGNNIGSMVFHKGNILQAFSPYSRAIGDLLVEEGIITEAELLETLRQQKLNGISPIGCLFLKTGKISLETIETMVHAQIRQAVKEFSAWGKLQVGFQEKDVQPIDHIQLPVNEFIPPDVIQSARQFITALSAQQ